TNGARVDDAVAAAGGPLPTADTDAINLADFVKDAERVYVPKKGQTSGPHALPVGGHAPGLYPGTTSATSTAPAPPPPHSVHGPFVRPEDLMDVKGIGQKRFDKMKDMITVR